MSSKSLLALKNDLPIIGDNVEKILEKISTYNIFNYLFPGVVFCVISDKYFSIPLIQETILNGIFLYYFVGLVISRFGSVVVEPSMKKVGMLKFSDYSDFILATKKDEKIEVLSEVNNMYRTTLSMIIVLTIVVVYNSCMSYWPGIATLGKYIVVGVLFLLFFFSYRKQTDYITKRITVNKDL